MRCVQTHIHSLQSQFSYYICKINSINITYSYIQKHTKLHIHQFTLDYKFLTRIPIHSTKIMLWPLLSIRNTNRVFLRRVCEFLSSILSLKTKKKRKKYGVSENFLRKCFDDLLWRVN